jgi:hypothetical protein
MFKKVLNSDKFRSKTWTLGLNGAFAVQLSRVDYLWIQIERFEQTSFNFIEMSLTCYFLQSVTKNLLNFGVLRLSWDTSLVFHFIEGIWVEYILCLSKFGNTFLSFLFMKHIGKFYSYIFMGLRIWSLIQKASIEKRKCQTSLFFLDYFIPARWDQSGQTVIETLSQFINQSWWTLL